MTNFTKLTIWQKALKFAREIYYLTYQFDNKLQYNLGDQLRRSSLSISSNIAEGSGSDSIKDELKYIGISIKSAYEVLSQLYFYQDISNSDQEKLIDSTTQLIKQMNAYRNSKRKYLNE